MGLTLYHLKNSRSQRVIWLLEELSLTYDIISYGHDDASIQQLNSQMKQKKGIGKSPVLQDDAILLAETGAIFEYLTTQYVDDQGKSLKPDPKIDQPAWLHYIFWTHFTEGSLIPYLAMKLLLSGIVTRSPFFIRPVMALVVHLVNKQYLHVHLTLAYQLVEQHLSAHTWFCGEQFSACDVLMGMMLAVFVEGNAGSRENYPFIYGFVDRMQLRPAYQRAVVRGDWSISEFQAYWKSMKGSCDQA